MKTKNSRLLTIPAALVASLAYNSTAQAQRAAPDRSEQRAQRRERVQNMSPEQRQQFFHQRFQERMQSMTPEQRQQFQQRMQQWQQNGGQAGSQNSGGRNGGGRNGSGRGANGGQAAGLTREQNQRRLLNGAGITDKAVQDAIIAFVMEQEKARQPLLAQARQLATDLGKPEITTEQRTTALVAFRTAGEADKVRYQEALKVLDQKIHYTSDPRLEAFLSLIGVVGDEVLPLGGAAAVFVPMPPAATPAKTTPATTMAPAAAAAPTG